MLSPIGEARAQYATEAECVAFWQTQVAQAQQIKADAEALLAGTTDPTARQNLLDTIASAESIIQHGTARIRDECPTLGDPGSGGPSGTPAPTNPGAGADTGILYTCPPTDTNCVQQQRQSIIQTVRDLAITWLADLVPQGFLRAIGRGVGQTVGNPVLPIAEQLLDPENARNIQTIIQEVPNRYRRVDQIMDEIDQQTPRGATPQQ